MELSISLSAESRRILEHDIIDLQEWLQNVVDNKLRKLSCRIIDERTTQQGKKLTAIERSRVITDIPLVPAHVRNAAAKQEIKSHG